MSLPAALRCSHFPALIGACVALTACALPPPQGERVPLRQPAAFAPLDIASNSPAPSAEYWKALGDGGLDALLAEALLASPTLQLADTRIRRALAITDAAGSALWPQVNAAFDSTTQRFTEKGLVPPAVAGSWRSNNRLALDAGLELDVWGKYRSALKGAEALREVARLEAQAARVTLTAALVRGWLEFDRLHRQRDVIQNIIEVREEIARLQSVRIKAGLDAEFDRTTQQLSLANLAAERAQTDERIALQRNLLAALAGQGPERGATLPRPAIAEHLKAGLPSRLPAELLANRPDVIAARWRVEAASQDVEVARRQFYPNVNLLAFLGFSSLGLDNLLDPAARVAGVGPAVRLPVFEAGRLRANLAMKSADLDAAVAHYNATLTDALREVCDQARSLEAVQFQAAGVASGLVAAQRGVRLVEARFSARQASRIMVLTAELQRLSQQRVAIDIAARGRDLAVVLARALGGGFTAESNPFTAAAAPHSS